MPQPRAVRFDHGTVDAVLSLDADVVRLRVTAGDCERLGLFAGRRVAMGIEDGGMHPALVTEIRRGESYAVVAVEFPARG